MDDKWSSIARYEWIGGQCCLEIGVMLRWRTMVMSDRVGTLKKINRIQTA